MGILDQGHQQLKVERNSCNVGLETDHGKIAMSYIHMPYLVLIVEKANYVKKKTNNFVTCIDSARCPTDWATAIGTCLHPQADHMDETKVRSLKPMV